MGPGREERLEDLVELFRRDAGPGVADLHLDRFRVDRGRDRDGPAVPHRLGGVQEEVQEHLLHLAAVHPGHEGLGRVPALEDDLPVGGVLVQDRQQVIEQRVQVGRDGVHRLRTREQQQVPHGPVQAVHLVDDLAADLGSRVGLPVPFEEDLAPAADAGERVADLVGEDRRHLPDRREHLPLHQAVLHLLERGDVADDPHAARPDPAVVVDRGHGQRRRRSSCRPSGGGSRRDCGLSPPARSWTATARVRREARDPRGATDRSPGRASPSADQP